MTKSYEVSWHFPRTELARTYLKALSSGGPTLAIFAERRKGKTEFLHEDVTPLAKSEGHLCCYINFWEDRSNPVACVVNGVERSFRAQAGLSLKGWKKEVSLRLGNLQAKVTKDADANVQTANAALYNLLETKGTIILQCDEVQHLATKPEFEEFTASLRTFIDSNRNRVRTIFTGSSQDNLNRLFRNQRAAFYNSASLVPFPDMGIEFVEFLVKRFHYLSGRQLTEDEVMNAFSKHHFSPAFIVELLQVMVRDGFYDVGAGIAHYHSINPLDESSKQIWNGLNTLEQLVLKHFARDNSTPLYHIDTYQSFAKTIGAKVTKSAVQVALNRLREEGLLNKVGHGQWSFENSELRSFVSDQIT